MGISGLHTVAHRLRSHWLRGLLPEIVLGDDAFPWAQPRSGAAGKPAQDQGGLFVQDCPTTAARFPCLFSYLLQWEESLGTALNAPRRTQPSNLRRSPQCPHRPLGRVLWLGGARVSGL